jgi:hypothetical protein
MLIKFLSRFFPSLSRPARIKRYEILLPLNYNDGSLIEAEKFDETAEELCYRDGKYGGTRYRDQLLRLRFDTNDPSAATFLHGAKAHWKERFRQIDIWITGHEIDVI